MFLANLKREATYGSEKYLTDWFVFYKNFLVDVLFSLCHFLYDMKKTKVRFMWTASGLPSFQV